MHDYKRVRLMIGFSYACERLKSDAALFHSNLRAKQIFPWSSLANNQKIDCNVRVWQLLSEILGNICLIYSYLFSVCRHFQAAILIIYFMTIPNDLQDSIYFKITPSRKKKLCYFASKDKIQYQRNCPCENQANHFVKWFIYQGNLVSSELIT